MESLQPQSPELTDRSPELLERCQRLQARAWERSQHVTPTHACQLPVWPETQRCLPNEILRSALFNARNRKQARRMLKDEEILVVGEGRITYGGEELRQDDELVWMHVLHLAKQQPLGERVEFIAGTFLLAFGWSTSGQSYQRLRTCLSRMQATSIQVHASRLGTGVSLSLIRMFEWRDADRSLERWRVWIEPAIYPLFSDLHYTRLALTQRQALPTGIASKLHGYYATHRHPYPIKIQTLKALCASDMTTKEFGRKLRVALTSLVDVGFLRDWRIARGLVQVWRK
jgi:hypothetical protein